MFPPRHILSLPVAVVVWLGWTCAALGGDNEDPITAWKRWKNIDAAVAVRSLDGPEDIIEKAEIVEDRVDELAREKKKLEKRVAGGRKKIRTLQDQRAVLQDMSEIQFGNGARNRMRLHEVDRRIRKAESMLKTEQQSLSELTRVLERMKMLAADYRKKAERLRTKESGV